MKYLLAILSVSLTTTIFSLGAIIVIEYNGQITGTPFGSSIASVGDSYSVQIAIPSNVHDSEPSDAYGSYRIHGTEPALIAVYTINDSIFSVPTTNYIDFFITNSEFSGNDRFEFEAFTGDDPGSGTFFNLFLVDNTRTALSTDQFPSSLEISWFTSVGSNLLMGGELLQGSINNFTYLVIPETSTSMLVLIGITTFCLTYRMRTSRFVQPATSRCVEEVLP